MEVSISTGGEFWAHVTGADEQDIIHKIATCYCFARERWPEEKTYIRGLTEQQMDVVHKIAKQLSKGPTDTQDFAAEKEVCNG